MVLNERGGPNHVGNFCDAPILADTKADKLTYNSSYYYMGHFAKYIRPARVRIGCTLKNPAQSLNPAASKKAAASKNPALEATAFRNADGKLAVVVMNRSDNAIDCAEKGQGAR